MEIIQCIQRVYSDFAYTQKSEHLARRKLKQTRSERVENETLLIKLLIGREVESIIRPAHTISAFVPRGQWAVFQMFEDLGFLRVTVTLGGNLQDFVSTSMFDLAGQPLSR